MASVFDTLSPAEIENYKAKGLTIEQMQQALNEVEKEETKSPSALAQSYAKAQQQAGANPINNASHSAYATNNQALDNIAKWQIELDSLLERVERVLKGDKPKVINGNVVWTDASGSQRIFTDYGVEETLRVLSMYVNKNTILSNYDETTINNKVYDFGVEISDLVYMKQYEFFYALTFEECFKNMYKVEFDDYIREFIKLNFEKSCKLILGYEDVEFLENDQVAVLVKSGQHFTKQILTAETVSIIKSHTRKEFFNSNHPIVLNVYKQIEKEYLEKRKLYPMIVRYLVDIVHSTYLRALGGKERDSLRQMINVSQQDSLQGGININNNLPTQKQGNKLLPWNWFK